MTHNGETKKDEGIGGCFGGVEHENGGGRLRLLTFTTACYCRWGAKAAVAAAWRRRWCCRFWGEEQPAVVAGGVASCGCCCAP